MHPYSEQPLQLFGLEYKEEVSLVKLLKATFKRKGYLCMSVRGIIRCLQGIH